MTVLVVFFFFNVTRAIFESDNRVIFISFFCNFLSFKRLQVQRNNNDIYLTVFQWGVISLVWKMCAFAFEMKKKNFKLSSGCVCM